MAGYRCAAGHTIEVPGGTYTTLQVQWSVDAEPVDYNYCMHCFAAWAVRQFPLIEQTGEMPDGNGG